ncbi:hypothetical protein CCACVL1_10370 [Corchorus capsularis]|uniref:Uncharacterized protein n=1 Tax=Corchorus capsularis TaxID=210143 RepID=A0A1R3IRI8_COCAP|nr:hypothetical protein CCACVL1_10370 [Corchorus capsularis]
MVAVAFYRGKLHRAPKPTPKISLKDFKSLLHIAPTKLSLVSAHLLPPLIITHPNPKPDSKPRLQPPKQNTPPIEP